jgi:hypothetical protein
MRPEFFVEFDDAKRWMLRWIKTTEWDLDLEITENDREDLCHLAEEINLASGPFTSRICWGETYWIEKIPR